MIQRIPIRYPYKKYGNAPIGSYIELTLILWLVHEIVIDPLLFKPPDGMRP